MIDFSNPKYGLSGIHSTHLRSGEKQDDVTEQLKEQHGYQLNYQKGGKINYFPITSYTDGSYQMDLMFPPKYKGVGIILCCIDISTRYLYAYCYKNKDQTYDYIKQFLEDLKRDNTKLTYIQMDRGSEFTNNNVKDLLKDIKFRYVNVGDKTAQGKVERVNETIRRLINNFISSNNTNDWVSVFDDLIYNYNHRYNRGLGGIPAKANYKTSLDKDVKKYKLAQADFDKFKVGDKVRILQKKDLFKKGRQTWSHEIYEIKGIEGNKFLMSNDGLERHYQLQKVSGASTNAKDDYDKVAKKEKKENKIIRALHKEGIVSSGDTVQFTREKRGRTKETYVGRTFRRKYGKKVYEGKVIKYLPKEGDDEEAWEIKYNEPIIHKNIDGGHGTKEIILSKEELVSGLVK